MNTYLFVWNPKRWPWQDLALRANENAAGKHIQEQWSCSANIKKIRKDDRAFLIKLGSEEPKGIIASGWVTSAPEPGPHWDEDKAAQGEIMYFADCEWERLLNPKIDLPLPFSILEIGKLAPMHWSSQSSGVSIRQEVADELETIWGKHAGKSSLGSVFADDEIEAYEGEEKVFLIRHRKREQWLRNAKLQQSRQKDGGRLVCEVPGCGFDFLKYYGEIGRDFAHVHHLKPLCDRTVPSATPLEDLAIVCANCHAMIHRGGKCRPLNQLIQRL